MAPSIDPGRDPAAAVRRGWGCRILKMRNGFGPLIGDQMIRNKSCLELFCP